MNRRQLGVVAAAAALLALGGCASLNQLTSEVTSFGQWPPNRGPGQYFIERLPSQVAASAAAAASAGAATEDRMGPLEQAAHQALQGAGFKLAPSLQAADVVVQIGARVTRYDISPWSDPLWWRWGSRYWRSPAWPGYRAYGPFYSPAPAWRSSPPPEREVAILLRDRATSVPLWEARAISSGFSSDIGIFQAMFSAALSDFPNARPQSRNVTVPLPPRP